MIAPNAAVVATVLSLSLAACTKVVTEEDAQYRRYAGTDPWTIEGIRPGDSLATATARHGHPSRSLPGTGATTLQWQVPDNFQVIVDGEGRIVEVLGRAIRAGNASLVSPGMTPDQVKRVLGPGDFASQRSPSGFVVQLGPGKVTGGTARYADGDAKAEISFGEDGVRWVRLSR